MPFGLWFRQPGPWVPASLCPLARSRRLAGRSPGRGLCWSRWPSPSSGFPHEQEQDLTGSLATLPVALRLSKTPDDPLHLACRGASGAAPRPNTPRASSVSMISRLTEPLSPHAVYASRRALPHAMQDSLPAGGLRLCRAGVEPAGSQRKVSVHVIPLSRAYPVASWVQTPERYAAVHFGTCQRL